jgi:hypothetical protein
MGTKITKYLDHSVRVFNFDDHLICIGLGSDVDEAFTELKDFCADLVTINPCYELITNSDPGNLLDSDHNISTLLSALTSLENIPKNEGEKIAFRPFVENKYFTKRKVLHLSSQTDILFTAKGEIFPHSEVLETIPPSLNPNEELLSLTVKSFRSKFKVKILRDKDKKVRTFQVLSPNGLEAEFQTISEAKFFCKTSTKNNLDNLEIYELGIIENKKTLTGLAPLIYKRYLATQRAKITVTYGEIKEKHLGKKTGFVFRIEKNILS